MTRTNNTSRRSTNRSNLLDCIKLIAFVAIAALLFMGISACHEACSKGFDESLAGQEATITYEYVMLREEPLGEIISQLDRGTSVTLTGNTCEYNTDGGDEDSWIEVQLYDGTTGWIVRNAVNPSSAGM